MSNEHKGTTKKVRLGCGDFAITVNSEEGEPIETFLRLGKSGSCAYCLLEGISRLIGLCLRSSMPIEDIIEELKDTTCGNGAWHDGVYLKSCLDSLGKELALYGKAEKG